MTIKQAQSLAPSYLHLPDDGADYRCDECKQMFSHKHVIKPFTPDGKIHLVQCLDCTDSNWLKTAKDCGVAE